MLLAIQMGIKNRKYINELIIFDVTGPRCPVSSEKDAGWSRSGGWGATSTVFVHLSTSWTDREGQDASKVNIMTILWELIDIILIIVNSLQIFTYISEFWNSLV